MKTCLKLFCTSLILAFPLSGLGADLPAGHPADPAPAAAPAETAPAHQHGMEGMQPAAAAPEAVKKAETITGKVVQTMNSGGYTYVYLDAGDRKVWVAAPETKLLTGEEVTFKAGAEMSNFPSTTLKRTFDKIIFSDGLVSKSGGKGGNKSPGSGGSVATGEKVKVEKATDKNAYTVSELFAKSAKLNKKKVVLRGKVMKVSSGIMSKNWVHIQDGSGSEKKGTHDIVVTSKDIPLVGDVVTVKGTLYKDKDFGGNYKYKAIIEEAEIAP
jgi:hypothetical protein